MNIADTAAGPGARNTFPPAADTFCKVSIQPRSPFASAMRIVVPSLVLTPGLLALRSGLLRVLFPAATCVFGCQLDHGSEAYFLSFLLWIYILAPLLRRLVDWKAFYQNRVISCSRRC